MMRFWRKYFRRAQLNAQRNALDKVIRINYAVFIGILIKFLFSLSLPLSLSGSNRG